MDTDPRDVIVSKDWTAENSQEGVWATAGDTDPKEKREGWIEGPHLLVPLALWEGMALTPEFWLHSVVQGWGRSLR